jgi:hypothetical protein
MTFDIEAVQMTEIAPKAFISYAWSSPAHEEWVLNLATRLVEDGVDIKLDKWDLGVGQDKYVFMESMVTDESVTKVILVSDKTYVEKANARTGGAGTEAQILTPELYKSAAESKFAAIIRELDVDGQPYVPAFFAGRIHISFVDDSYVEKSYDELLRWLLGKPLHVKPKLGKQPESITNPTLALVGTTSSHKRACDAIREGRSNAAGLTQEYATIFLSEMAALRPTGLDAPDYDDIVLASADAMRIYIRQLGELILAAARFSSPSIDEIIGIHEGIARLTLRPVDTTQWYESAADPFKMIAYESFLQLIAILIQERSYDFLQRVVDKAYFITDPDRWNGPKTRSFTVFSNHVGSLEHRKKRLKQNWIDMHATLIHGVQKDHWPSFEQLMQADFLLFLIASMRGVEGAWYPRTLVYKQGSYSPFEIFARSESVGFFNSWALRLFSVTDFDDFRTQISKLDPTTNRFYDYNGLAVSRLANAEFLGTKP